MCGTCVDADLDPSALGKTCADCRGVANGGWTNDLCAICLPPDDANRDDACKDCAGVRHGGATSDCKGTCAGTAMIDACGMCLEPSDPNFVQTAGTACISGAASSAATDDKISKAQTKCVGGRARGAHAQRGTSLTRRRPPLPSLFLFLFLSLARARALSLSAARWSESC